MKFKVIVKGNALKRKVKVHSPSLSLLTENFSIYLEFDKIVRLKYLQDDKP